MPRQPDPDNAIRDLLLLAAVLVLIGAAFACGSCERIDWLAAVC
jgi:hypothetical protein